MLDLIWTAVFNDKTLINQFDNYGTQTEEHLFKEVLDNQEKLVKFVLKNIHTHIIYIVNLENGTINITLNGSEELEPDTDMLREGSYKYRLIYFRRVQRHFTPELIETEKPNITYFIGFQYTDSSSHNQKRFLKINSDGRLIVN